LTDDQVAALLDHREYMFSPPYLIPNPRNASQVAHAAWLANQLSDFVPSDQNVTEPVSEFYYPLAAGASDIAALESASATDALVTPTTTTTTTMTTLPDAIIVATVYWRTLMRNVLAKRSHGIHIVFTNPCTLPFTYQLNGPDVVYLGVGDFHERAYDGTGKSNVVHELGSLANPAVPHAHSDAELLRCPLTMQVYPSQQLKAAFATNNALIFAVATLCIFAFTSIVFLVYDHKVERRQHKVMAAAVQSSAIVSSLFPSAVRARLYPTSTTTTSSAATNNRQATGSGRKSKRPKKTSGGLLESPQENAEHFDYQHASDEPNRAGGVGGVHGSPIAELYPETTVLFADIVGFTAWSSVRQPTHVFYLLESVYGAFDVIAKQRGVFKVETIGDTYVAVVGLPTPRRHHAVIMARFAADCRHKMRQVTQELSHSLGPVSVYLHGMVSTARAA
jgi:Adenylate and Guanylate cyclase catalytic domain